MPSTKSSRIFPKGFGTRTERAAVEVVWGKMKAPIGFGVHECQSHVEILPRTPPGLAEHMAPLCRFAIVYSILTVHLLDKLLDNV